MFYPFIIIAGRALIHRGLSTFTSRYLTESQWILTWKWLTGAYDKPAFHYETLFYYLLFQTNADILESIGLLKACSETGHNKTMTHWPGSTRSNGNDFLLVHSRPFALHEGQRKNWYHVCSQTLISGIEDPPHEVIFAEGIPSNWSILLAQWYSCTTWFSNSLAVQPSLYENKLVRGK